MMRRFTLGVFLLLSSIPGLAQVATGNYPFGTFDSHGFDSVNVGNLNIHFTIPVINKPGRGLPFYYNLSYDSSVWYPTAVNGSNVWAPVQSFGWRGDTEVATSYISYRTSSYSRMQGRTLSCIGTLLGAWTYHDTNGTAHTFAGYASQYEDMSANGTSGNCPPSHPNFTMVATDGSGFTLAVTNLYTAALTSPQGKSISPPISNSGSGVVTDANGNQVSTDGNGNFTDTTGQRVLQVAGNAPSAQTYTYTDKSGTPRAVTMSFRSYTVQTNFGCSGVGEYGPTSTSLVDSISLADGTAYHFAYEPTPGISGAVTGRPSMVTLPGGGRIAYSYSGSNNGIVCGDGSTAGLTRTMLDDSPNTSWTYSRSPGTSTSHTNVVDGLGNNLNYDFVAATLPSGALQPGAFFYEVNRNAWNGAASGTHALTKATCYNGSGSSCVGTAITLPIAQVDTYQTFSDSVQGGGTVKFNGYGLQTEIDVYDYGSSSSRGSLLSKETFNYGGCGPANLVSSDVLMDGAGNVLSNKTYCYDQTSVAPTSGLPSHVAASGPRGNMTTSSQWVNTANSSISQTFTYEDTGQVLTAVDGRGNTTSYAYDAATHAFPSTTTYPKPSSNVAIATSTQYDTVSGVLLKTIDPNNQTTSYATYDPLLRPTEVDFPDGGKTTVSYTATEVTASQLRQSGNSITTIADSDGYGRQLKTTLNDPEGNDIVDYTYDGNGNTRTVTNPHRSSGSSTDGTTTYTYDVLGRQVSQMQPDGSVRSSIYSGNTVILQNETAASGSKRATALAG